MNSAQYIEKLYPHLPVSMQNWMCSEYGRREAAVRFGPVFEKRLRQLHESDFWSVSEIDAYQNEQIKRIIKHSYDHVPFYRDQMRRLKLTPADICSKEDLVKLPILSKEMVRQNIPRLLSKLAHRRNLVSRHTAGSTGKSLHFYLTREAVAFQWAVWWRHRSRFGISPGASHVNFTGKLVVPAKQMNPPFWRWNRPMSQALINMQHILPHKMPAIVEFLNSHDFEFYSGSPSVISAFCALGNEMTISLNRCPKAIFTGIENILADQRREMEDFTGAIVTDQYGQTEGCGNLSQCTEMVYHEDFEFGLVECVDEEVLESGEKTGRVVCTGFSNDAFPFIRYDTGDVATWARDDESCTCGRSSRIIKRIEGRIDDYIVTPEGHRIMRLDYLFKETSQIKESQVVQKELGSIVVRIVRREDYSLRNERMIRDLVIKYISPTLLVDFEYVSEIEREPNGKFKAVKRFC